MTDTARRTLLGALALGPFIAATPAAAHAARVPSGFIDLATDEMLRLGAALPSDRAFAAICAQLLAAYEAEERAWTFYREADDMADAAAPFPAALLMRCRYKAHDGTVDEWDEQWKPAGDTMGLALQRLAMRKVHAAGGDQYDHTQTHPVSLQLRAEWDEWQRAHLAARAHYLVPELEAAAESASKQATQRFSALLRHRPRSLDALRIKLSVRCSEHGDIAGLDDWRGLLSDLDSAVSQ